MTQPERTWSRRTLMQGLAAVAGAVLACWPAWRDIAVSATVDPDNSYIVMVPAVAGWLALCRRRRLRSAGRRGPWLGVAIAALGACAYLYGGWAGQALALHLGAIMVLIGAVWSVVGQSVMLRMLPAIVALLFLAPVPMAWLLPMTDLLGRWSAAVAAFVLEALGMPATANGPALIVGGSGLVLGDDGGVRMIAAIGLVTYAFAFGSPLRQGVRVLLVLASPLVAMAANVLRLVPTAFVAEHHPRIMGPMAQFSGWLTLVVAFAVILGTLRLLRYAHVPARRYALAYQ